ncbi:alpha/beta hydrolase family protein [Dactylosporangium sp. CS-033363]|uniref:alpha/beta hydrolase family protein n=1 Tax=Dactylosporangium sp. CS-033363 TaxID=3239935 RepID=UPI003D925B9E
MRLFTGVCCVLLLAGCSATAEPAGPASPASPADPAPTTAASVCGDPELTGKAVRFPGKTGAELGGYLVGTGGVTLVLAPQASATSCSWLSWAKGKAAAGYRVLAFDFNGEGTSRRADTGKNSDDVAAAAAYARTGGSGKVVLIGASRGATATLIAAAAMTPPPAAVISLSGPSSYGGESALDAVPKLTAPVLYVAAKGDTGFADTAQAMHDATPGQSRKLVLVEGSLHGTALLTITAEGAPEATKAVDDYLRTTAPPA